VRPKNERSNKSRWIESMIPTGTGTLR
jgi:hypothetical protein